MEKALGAVEIRTFAGMATVVDPGDMQDGVAEVQLNLDSSRSGEISPRLGLRDIVFDEEN